MKSGVLSKEELKYLLGKYKRLFSSEIFSYLNSLMELEISIVNDNISDEDKNLLFELGIYEKIYIYNIYQNILNIANSQEKFKVEIYCHLLRVLNENNYKLCDFQIGDKSSYSAKDNQLFLYQRMESEDLRELTLKDFINKLESLEKAECPWTLSECSRNNDFSKNRKVKRENWILRNKHEIQELKDKIKELNQDISDLDRKNIENSMRFSSLVLKVIGIDEEDYEKVLEKYLYCGVKNNMEKTLVKTLPYLKINRNIKFL